MLAYCSVMTSKKVCNMNTYNMLCSFFLFVHAFVFICVDIYSKPMLSLSSPQHNHRLHISTCQERNGKLYILSLNLYIQIQTIL